MEAEVDGRKKGGQVGREMTVTSLDPGRRVLFPFLLQRTRTIARERAFFRDPPFSFNLKEEFSIPLPR